MYTQGSDATSLADVINVDAEARNQGLDASLFVDLEAQDDDSEDGSDGENIIGTYVFRFTITELILHVDLIDDDDVDHQNVPTNRAFYRPDISDDVEVWQRIAEDIERSTVGPLSTLTVSIIRHV
jgi:hypothetical protein